MNEKCRSKIEPSKICHYLNHVRDVLSILESVSFHRCLFHGVIVSGNTQHHGGISEAEYLNSNKKSDWLHNPTAYICWGELVWSHKFAGADPLTLVTMVTTFKLASFVDRVRSVRLSPAGCKSTPKRYRGGHCWQNNWL
jgi:hypothetical protein